MSLIKYRPSREMARQSPTLFGEWNALDRMFNSVFSDFWNDAQGAGAAPAIFSPPIDIAQDAESVVVRAELPGVKKEDVEITFHDNTLTLRGSKRMEKTEEKENGKEGEHRYHYVERRYGEFLRTFTLPDTVDTEKAKADFKDGVLEIRMPIQEQAKPRKIEISAN